MFVTVVYLGNCLNVIFDSLNLKLMNCSIFSLRKLLACLLIGACFSFSTLYGQELTAAGDWKGSLEVNGQSIPLIFHLKTDDKGEWTGSFDSPKQMVYDIAFDKITIKEQDLRLEVTVANVVYEGKLKEAGAAIEGEWLQGGAAFPLRLTRTQSTVLKRPQTPKAPFPYDVETVEFSNKKAGINLAGTITLPAGKQNCPAVVLISGSGPQDRNSTILKHQPFWVLADYLTRQGMVVLRVDDRGVGESGGTFSGATSADFATDVAAAFAYLQKHPRVNSNKVGLLGHSEGGVIAPMVASTEKEVAFIVLLAGPGQSGSEVLRQQNYDMTMLATKNVALAQKQSKVLEKLYALVLAPENQDQSTSEIMQLLKAPLEELSDDDREKLGWTNAVVAQIVAQLRTPWFQYFLATNPQDYLQKVSCPVLAINGEKDLQVHANNLEAIEEALKQGKNKNYSIQAFPNLNHLLQTAETGAVAEYVKIEETMAPEVLAAIHLWLEKVAVY